MERAYRPAGFGGRSETRQLELVKRDEKEGSRGDD